MNRGSHRVKLRVTGAELLAVKHMLDKTGTILTGTELAEAQVEMVEEIRDTISACENVLASCRYNLRQVVEEMRAEEPEAGAA